MKKSFFFFHYFCSSPPHVQSLVGRVASQDNPIDYQPWLTVGRSNRTSIISGLPGYLLTRRKEALVPGSRERLCACEGRARWELPLSAPGLCWPGKTLPLRFSFHRAPVPRQEHGWELLGKTLLHHPLCRFSVVCYHGNESVQRPRDKQGGEWHHFLVTSWIQRGERSPADCFEMQINYAICLWTRTTAPL